MNQLPSAVYKSMILNHPTMYKTSWDCMKSIFLRSDNGFYFNSDGQLCHDLDLNIRHDINRTGLSVFKEMADRSAEQVSLGSPDAERLHKKNILTLNFQTLLFDFIEQHIDSIASMHRCFTEELDPCFKDLDGFFSNSLFWNVPKNIDEAWKKEFIATGDQVKHLLWKDFGIHTSPEPLTNRLAWHRSDFYCLYVRVCDKMSYISPKVAL